MRAFHPLHGASQLKATLVFLGLAALLACLLALTGCSDSARLARLERRIKQLEAESQLTWNYATNIDFRLLATRKTTDILQEEIGSVLRMQEMDRDTVRGLIKDMDGLTHLLCLLGTNQQLLISQKLRETNSRR